MHKYDIELLHTFPNTVYTAGPSTVVAGNEATYNNDRHGLITTPATPSI